MKKPNVNLIGSLIGNALEYYDVTLYGFFAPILGSIFFPSSNPFMTLLLTLGGFAIGFLARPIGGLIFGFVGDKFGRKIALMYTIFIVTIPTIVIGMIPSYEAIGMTAPILLIFCRLIQGICTGGEYSGAVVFTYEHAPIKRKSFFSSIVPTSGIVGATIGTLAGAFFSQQFMPVWGWRIPFILGGVFGFIGFLLRNKISETETFKTSQKTSSPKIPLLNALKLNKANMVGTILLGMATMVPFYMVTVYMTSFMKHPHLTMTHSERFLLLSAIMVLFIIALPTFGFFADKYGSKVLIASSCLFTAIISVPAFHWAYSAKTVLDLFFATGCISLTAAAFSAPTASYFASLFRAESRYSSLGFGICVGEAIGGGTTPLIATLLAESTNNPIAPAFYLIGISIIVLIALKISHPVTSPELT
jgi:MHS family proline/betaine transporter-like MFS transporter